MTKSLPALALALALTPALAAGDEITALRAGTTLTREIKGGERHLYSLDLAAGESARLEVFQRGVDVVVSALDASGHSLREVDSPNGTVGPEPLAFTAPTAGTYQVAIAPGDPAARAGRYEVRGITRLDAAETARHQFVPPDLAVNRSLAGVYDLADGSTTVIGPLGEIGGALIALDLRSREVRGLFPRSATDFLVGSAFLEDVPTEADVAFAPGSGGRVDLTWTPNGGKARAGTRRAQRREAVTFQNGDVTLHGDLILPAGKGPFAAVVIAHGSGPSSRDLAFFPPYFTGLGLAVLAFDKRGVGESTGDWRVSALSDLAGDVLAGIALLKARPDIDPARIGIWGVSQGGWVGTLAASRSADVHFLVLHAGSGMPVFENVAYEQEGAMREALLSEADVQEGVAFNRRTGEMASRGAAPEEVVALAQAVRDRPWAEFAFPAGRPPGDPWWTWYRLNGLVDSAALLPQVRCPVLWFLGDKDRLVSFSASEPRLRAALGALPDGTLHVIHGAGHALLEADSGFQSETPHLERFAPGYLDTMAAWLDAHLARRP